MVLTVPAGDSTPTVDNIPSGDNNHADCEAIVTARGLFSLTKYQQMCETHDKVLSKRSPMQQQWKLCITKKSNSVYSIANPADICLACR